MTEDMDKAIAEIWAMFRETDKRSKETFQYIKETEKSNNEAQWQTDQQIRKTDQQIKEVGKQIDGLGNKFGGFTEVMAFPSMQRILMEKFNVDNISTRVIARKNGKNRGFKKPIFSQCKSNGDVK